MEYMSGVKLMLSKQENTRMPVSSLKKNKKRKRKKGREGGGEEKEGKSGEGKN